MAEPEDNTVSWWLNYYECPCGCEWSDEWDCTCDDRCPECNTSCSPSDSEELEEITQEEAARRTS